MNYFQTLAQKYDSWFQTPHGRYVWQTEREMILSLALVKPGDHIADIGCGTGIYTAELLAAGASVTALDISPEMLEINKQRNAAYGEQAAFLQGDAAKLPLADNSFDAVISVTAMEFFEEPGPCLKEMLRIVKPGGYMVVATLNRLSLWAMQRRVKSWLRPTIFSNASFYSLGDVRRMLEPYYSINAWRGGVFVPPFAPARLIESPDSFERWGQKRIPQFGAFLAVRVDKKS